MGVVHNVRLDVPLPERYLSPWQEPFVAQIRAQLRPGISILDVGAGRNPTIAPKDRPLGAQYVGLDPSRDELEMAGAGAYDGIAVTDLETRVPALLNTFDLAISWQVFEHVRRLDAAFDNLYDYLHFGGCLVTLFSGRWSAFGVVNRLLPNSLGTRLVERSMRRRGSAQPVFPAFYDHCSDRGIRRVTAKWDTVEVTPLFRAGMYFHFSRVLTRAYLSYENAAHRLGAANLATHYLVVAHK